MGAALSVSDVAGRSRKSENTRGATNVLHQGRRRDPDCDLFLSAAVVVCSVSIVANVAMLTVIGRSKQLDARLSFRSSVRVGLRRRQQAAGLSSGIEGK